MLHKLRQRAQDEKGFTLIELLVVILIIGILAAIAIPAFLNQRTKAYDAATKSNLVTAQTAEETYATDNNGAYTADSGTTGSGSALAAIEPALKNAPGVTAATQSGGYVLTASSNGPSGSTDTFTLSVANGAVTRTCTPVSTGGCSSGGTW
jgi:type IV pilus assembly protein PilA